MNINSEVTRSILAKIQKLLRLADPSRGATPAEAAQAMARAQELITKHGIEQSDLDFTAQEHKPQFDIGEEAYVTDQVQRYDFETNIARILIQCFGVKVIWIKRMKVVKGVNRARHGYLLVGDKMDIELSKMAIPLLYDAMFGGARAYCRMNDLEWKAPVYRAYYDGLEQGYVQGNAQGRAKAYAQANKASADRYALVLVDKKDAIVAFFNEKHPNLKDARSRGPAFKHAGAYGAGFAKGSSMDLSGHKLA